MHIDLYNESLETQTDMGYKRRQKNRVVHGDSLELIPKYLELSSVDLVACDPPYG